MRFFFFEVVEFVRGIRDESGSPFDREKLGSYLILELVAAKSTIRGLQNQSLGNFSFNFWNRRLRLREYIRLAAREVNDSSESY